MSETILLVDDDKTILSTLRKILSPRATHIVTAASLGEARAALLSQKISVVFCDLVLPDGSGLDFLRFSKQQSPPPEVIILTAEGGFDSVVRAIQLGACHYLEKPVASLRVGEVLEYARERWDVSSQVAKSNETQGRALVLDDNHVELMVINNILSTLGYIAQLTDNYESAVGALKSQSFDLIVCDVVLKEKSGLDFLAFAQDYRPDVPVLMVTASKGIETAISALRGGAYDFLTKPLNRELFETAVLRARELSRARQERIRLEIENESYRTRLEELSADLNRRVQSAVGEVSRLREFAEMILRSFPMAIVTTDTELRITQTNPAVLRYLGVSQESLEGKSIQDIFGLRPFASDLDEVCNKGVRISKRSTTLDDLSLGQITISYGCAPLLDTHTSDIKGAILYFTDITNAEQLDDLMEGENLVAMESLISSLAHEVNNPLTVAQGMAQILQHDYELDPEAERLMNSLQKALDRCSAILKEKSESTRRDRSNQVTISIHECIDKVLDFYKLKLLDTGVKAQRTFECAHGFVESWGTELEQVLINLIKNSRDAMPEGGNLHIRTSSKDQRVVLEVEDTGEGMPTEDIPRLLLPHVSTKPPGKGSGLGLSICQSIIRHHQGRMEIESQTGKGTTVRIELPVSKPSLKLVSGDRIGPGSSLRVAVLDDEPEIRQYCETILQRAGFSPRIYADPESALDALKESPVDVAILDVVMPGMDGLEICERLLEVQPNIQIVFMTGSARGWLKRRSQAEPRFDIIWKPFKEEDILGAVRKAADNLEEAG